MTTQTPGLPSLQGAVRLADWGVIRAVGDDAASFLQGQLTQDVLHIGAERARLAGYCSAKGRLLASFVVWARGPGELLLACSADLLPATLKRLTMFVLRAKCKLSDASAEVPLYGLAGAAAVQALGADAPAAAWHRSRHGEADVIRLPDAAGTPRFLWAGADVPELPLLAEGDWRWLEVQSGVARIVAATVEQFVPQMVNLELVGGVNFQKGCYPGQEVVARSQYRGTLKRRAFLFDSEGAAAPGQEVFASDDPEQPAGMVAGAAPRPDGSGRYSVLAETKLSVLDGDDVSLHVGSPAGPAPGRDCPALRAGDRRRLKPRAVRRHYVYYRVAERDVPAVVEALRPLRERQPFELLRRPGTSDGVVTLMEVHADAAVEAEAAALLGPWLAGERHRESFDPLP